MWRAAPEAFSTHFTSDFKVVKRPQRETFDGGRREAKGNSRVIGIEVGARPAMSDRQSADEAPVLGVRHFKSLVEVAQRGNNQDVNWKPEKVIIV